MTGIKISELSIGDWVRYDFPEIGAWNMQVTSIDEEDNHIGAGGVGASAWSDVSEFEPIRLTPEILDNNGFRKNGEYNEWNIGEWDEHPFIGVSLDRQCIRIKHFGNDIYIEGKVVYVHHLQHALRLAGVEKEIEL